MIKTFICPDCGKETQKTSSNKMFCRECAKKRAKERCKAASYQRLQEEKESNAIKAAAKQVEKYANAAHEEQKARDAEIDARSRNQIKLQCRFCKYQLRQGSNCQNRCIGCDYISWKGHSTEKGNGVGDCRSFEPLTKETKAERTARRKRAITISEADKAQYTGEKMREVNQL